MALTAMEKAMNKANKFCEVAKANGWDIIAISVKNGDETHVEVARNKERITIWWRGNSLVETPFHHYMGQQRSLHNAHDATEQLSKKPSASKVRGASVGRRFTNIALDKNGDAILPEDIDIQDLKDELPFTEEDSDATILKALRGHTIIFLNRISGKAESVHIPKSLNMDLEHRFYLEESAKGELYVSFLAATGFRSVYIDSILRVM